MNILMPQVIALYFLRSLTKFVTRQNILLLSVSGLLFLLVTKPNAEPHYKYTFQKSTPSGHTPDIKNRTVGRWEHDLCDQLIVTEGCDGLNTLNVFDLRLPQLIHSATYFSFFSSQFEENAKFIRLVYSLFLYNAVAWDKILRKYQLRKSESAATLCLKDVWSGRCAAGRNKRERLSQGTSLPCSPSEPCRCHLSVKQTPITV